jgi:hypothetical protein
LEFVYLGAIFYIVGRMGSRSGWDHFGAWRSPPRWARFLFGSYRGSISPYRLALELWGLSWIIPGCLIWAKSDWTWWPWRAALTLVTLLGFVGACAWCAYVALWPEVQPILSRRRPRR